LKILEVLVVALYQDPVICPLEVVSPLLHGFHDREEFPIVRVIVLFGGRALSRVEIDWS
jgi:hypothetical protein